MPVDQRIGWLLIIIFFFASTLSFPQVEKDDNNNDSSLESESYDTVDEIDTTANEEEDVADDSEDEAAILKYKGYIGFEHWGFPKSGQYNQTSINNSVELQVEGSLELDFFKAFLSPRFKEDFSETDRNRLLIDEGWIQFAGDFFDLRFGIQKFSWGMVESEKLVDVLNQKDYEDDFLDPDKYGELSARLSLAFPDPVSWLQEIGFQFYYLAQFTQATFPGTKGRYNLTNGLLPVSDQATYSSSSKKWMPQYAFRTIFTFSDVAIDIALSYFHGYNRFPSLSTNIFTRQITPYYYILDQGGLELTWVVKSLIIKLESVYRNTNQTDFNRIPSTLVPAPYFAYVGGVEYTINGIIGNNDISFFLEYLGDSNVGTKTVDYRLFQNDLFVGFRYSLNDVNSKELKTGLTIDLDHPEEFLYLVEYNQRLAELFTVAFRLDGVRSRANSRLDTFKEELRLKALIKYYFASEE